MLCLSIEAWPIVYYSSSGLTPEFFKVFCQSGMSRLPASLIDCLLICHLRGICFICGLRLYLCLDLHINLEIPTELLNVFSCYQLFAIPDVDDRWEKYLIFKLMFSYFYNK